MKGTQSDQYSKFIGIGFILFTLLGAFHYSLIDLKILGVESKEAFLFIKENIRLFRIGIILDLFLFVIGVFLFVSLYFALKVKHHFIALFALCLLLIEIAITIKIEASSFMLLHLEGEHTASSLNHLAEVDMILNARASGYLIVTFLFAFAMILNSYLISKFNRITTWIAWWAMLSYGLLFIAIIMNVLIPDEYPKGLGSIASISCMLFQLIFGTLLLFKKKTLSDINN